MRFRAGVIQSGGIVIIQSDRLNGHGKVHREVGIFDLMNGRTADSIALRMVAMSNSCTVEYNPMRSLLFCILFNLFSSVLPAFEQDSIYLLTAIEATEIEIETADQEQLKIGIDTNGLERELQGNIPIMFLLEREETTFDNGERELLWHKRGKSIHDEKNRTISNSPIVHVNFKVNEELSNKKLKVRIQKEEDLSKTAAIAALFPQMIPFFLPGDVNWSLPSSSFFYFYHALMRLNYKVFDGDILKLTRGLITSHLFDESRPLLSQCSADVIEGFALFNIANYGEPGFNIQQEVRMKSKTDTFRGYVTAGAIKKYLDCISSIVAESLFEMQKKPFMDWPQLPSMNKESVVGLSKIMVGYSFNAFAFEAGDFLKLAKQAIKGIDAGIEKQLEKDLDRSLVKAIQFTIQSGYEDYFKGQLKKHGFNEVYAIPMAASAGSIEILWRFINYQKTTNLVDRKYREVNHQFNSFTKRTEAIAISLSKSFSSRKLTGQQVIAMGIAMPVLVNAAIFTTAYYYPTPLSSLFTAGYEGLIISSLTYFITPTLQQYGAWAFRTIQKPVLDYLNSEPDSWSKYLLADDIRYRVNIYIEDQQ